MTARTRLETGIARGWPLPPSDVAEVLAESDAHRTRADATESECARLRGEIAAACAARDEARAVERERCAALCDAAAARWGTAGDRWKRSNEAAALAAEMRAWPVTP